jgi:DNA-binding MarR family transcriptional regulator
MQLQSILNQAGLDRHETDIYLSLIQLGDATAGELSKTSGVPRTYTYKVLESLEDKGFVHQRQTQSIRRYSITDFEAPKRYIEQKQLELYRLQQQAQTLSHQLESFAHPEAPTAIAESLQDHQGEMDFWQLMHSTLTREIWVINPPDWWGSSNHSLEVKKWENFRKKQHIWEMRHCSVEKMLPEAEYVESKVLHSNPPASLFLIDHYQVQVTNWAPFRAIRIESQEMIELQKGMLQ